VQWPIVTQADRDAIENVLSSGHFTCFSPGGGAVRQLELEWARFVGTRYAVAVTNGTAALSVALTALGCGPGDEVIVPSLSFVASGIAAVHAGAVPVFVDIQQRSFNIDPHR